METIKIQVFMSRIKDATAFLQMTINQNITFEARETGKKKLCMMDLPTSFVYDKDSAYIFWVEFATEEEAAIFKLTYL